MENLVSTLALQFFIGSSLFLQVTMTAIIYKHGWVRNWARLDQGSAELATLESRKNLYRLIMEEML